MGVKELRVAMDNWWQQKDVGKSPGKSESSCNTKTWSQSIFKQFLKLDTGRRPHSFIKTNLKNCFQLKQFPENSPLTKLVVELKDTDPDDSFSSVPYEKGSCFLYYLERILGGPG